MTRHLIGATLLSNGLALLLVACGSTSVTEVAGPTGADRCQSSIASVPSFPASGGSNQTAVTAPRECQWTATSQATWLRVSPAAGQGESVLTVTAEANPAASPRSGGVALNGQTITVMQVGAECRYELSTIAIQMGADGGRRSVEVTAPGGCAWTTRSPVDWIEAATPTGSGSGPAHFDVDENTGLTRTTTLQVAGQSVTLVQAGSTPSREEPAPPGVSPTAPETTKPPEPGEPGPPSQPDDPCPPKGGGKECRGR